MSGTNSGSVRLDVSPSPNLVEVRFGRGVASEVVDLMEPPVLFVTGRAGLQRSGLDVLAPSRHAVTGVEPNPSPATIDAATGHAVAIGARTIVGVGGGSALDAAKCVAAVTGNAAGIREFVDAAQSGVPLVRTARLVQVPTTAGTGSEVTRWASVWEGGAKWSMDHEAGWADVALVDPALTDSMGPRLTAATGLDAMAHAIEAMWSRHARPSADRHATEALGLIVDHLVPAITDPTDQHRDAMSRAALEAGLALSETRSAGAHALSYELTAQHGIEHGLAVGMLCRALLPWNHGAAPDRVGAILDAMGADDVSAAQAHIDSVFAAAGLRCSLGSFGVPEAAWRAVASAALATDRLANNPGEPTTDDLVAALRSVA